MTRIERRRFLWLLAGIGLMTTGCGTKAKPEDRTAVVVLDTKVRLAPESVTRMPFELRPEHAGAQLRVEIANLGSTVAGGYLLEKAQSTEQEASRDWAYLTALSEDEIRDRFDSGWVDIEAPGVYVLLVRAHGAAKAGDVSPAEVSFRISRR